MNIELEIIDNEESAPRSAHSSCEYPSKYKHYRTTRIFSCHNVIIILILVSLIISGVLIIYFKAPVVNDNFCEYQLVRKQTDPIDYTTKPLAIATADFNGDNLLDIVIVFSEIDTLEIFFGIGDGLFPNKTSYHLEHGSTPSSVALGYINDDDHIDIAVANYGLHTIDLFFGLSNGIFQLADSIYIGRCRPSFIQLLDIDRDEQCDLLVVGNGIPQVVIYYAIGKKPVGKISILYTGDDSIPVSFSTGDLNNDGRLDIIVANSGTNTIGIFIQKYDLTFEQQISFSTGLNSKPSFVAVEDLNNDGGNDIVVSNFNSRNVIIMLGFGNGTFRQPDVYNLNISSPTAISINHFDKDGKLDLVLSCYGEQNVILLYGLGDGTFSSPIFYKTGSFESVSTISDSFNNDGVRDFAVVNSDTSKVDVFVAYQSFFQLTQEVHSSVAPNINIVTNLNHDRYVDLIIGHNLLGLIMIYIGGADGIFDEPSFRVTKTSIGSMIVAYTNDDDEIDLILTSSLNKTISVLFSIGNNNTYEEVIQSTVSEPAAIVSGDFNNDRIIDIAVIFPAIKEVDILLGYGNGSFIHHQSLKTVNSPSSLVTVDLNNDDVLDIAVTDRSNNSISIFLGFYNGTFHDHGSYPTGEDPFFLCFGDLNHDGNIDLVVLNIFSFEVSVHIGVGDGGFLERNIYPTSSEPTFAVIMDATGDGLNDVVVSFQYTNKIELFAGLGNGRLRYQGFYATSSGPGYLSVADFNMDGYLDFAVTNFGSSNIGIYLHKYQNQFRQSSTLSSGNSSALQYLASADLNHDGNVDLIITTFGSYDLGVLFSDGRGNFDKQRFYAIEKNRFKLAGVGYFNSDSILDLVILGYDRDITVLYLGDNDQSFHKQIELTEEVEISEYIAVADLNDDNISEVITVTSKSHVNILIPYRFCDLKIQTRKYWITKPTSLALGDFDHDGKIDFLAINGEIQQMEIYLGLGDGNFFFSGSYQLGRNPIDCTITDINNDRMLDSIVINLDDKTIDIFLGNGDGTFSYYSTIQHDESFSTVTVKDVNDDNQPDILVTNALSDTVCIYPGEYNLEFKERKIIYVGYNPHDILAIDLNFDQYPDLVMISPLLGRLYVVLGSGNLTFDSVTVYELGVDCSSFDVSDLNGDRHLDIVTSIGANNSLGILFGLSDSLLMKDAIYLPTCTSPFSVKIADMNKDDLQDIVVLCKGDNTLNVHYGFGNGTFGKYHSFSTGSLPKNLAIADFNNDTQLDVIVSNLWGNSLMVYLGSPNYALILNRTLRTDKISTSHALAIADVNTDKLLDIVIAYSDQSCIGIFFNEGNLYFSRQHLYSTGVGSTPTSLVLNDFNQDNYTDMLFTDSSADSLVLYLSNGNGSFLAKYSTFTGSSTNPRYAVGFDFNQDGLLDIGYINSANNNIEILLGFGNGTFGTRITAVIPFGSKPISFVVGDFNSDTRQDIAVLNTVTDNINVFINEC